MRCSDFHERINHLLDDRLELSQDAAVQEHASVCKDCHRDLQNYQLLVNRGPQTVPKQQPISQLTSPLFWLTVAATVFIAVTYFPRVEQPTQTALTNPVVAPVVVAHEDVDVAPINVSSNDRVVVSGHFVQPILSIGYMATADWSSVEPMEMPFGVSVPTVEAEWIDVVADEMLPIQQSVNSTFDLIVRTLSASA